MRLTLDRIEQLNGWFNAIVSLRSADELYGEAEQRDMELAQGKPRGWLHGMPMAIKDTTLTEGLTTTLGSPILRDYVPAQDAYYVERIKRAGAIIIGKTNVPEFGLGSNSYNNVFGTTANAFDVRKVAGGSSGGAAVALAHRMVAVADGSDMMGSLRNPAAWNNIYGFRPTFGRVAHGPANDVFGQTLIAEGPMARSVEDLALLLSTMAGFDARSPNSLGGSPSVFAAPLSRNVDGDLKEVRVGWLGDWGGAYPFEPGILDLCQVALDRMAELGAGIDRIRPPFDAERLWRCWLVLRGAQVFARLRPYFENNRQRRFMKREAIWECERAMRISIDQYFAACAERTSFINALLPLFDQYDVLAMPSVQCFPFNINLHWPNEIAGRKMDTYHRWMEVTVAATLLGAPAISVPVGFNSQRLPMGMQLIGAPRSDLFVLQIADAYDRATRWPQKVLPHDPRNRPEPSF